MKDGVAEALMPRLRHLREALEKRVGFAGDQLRQVFAVQALEQSLVAGTGSGSREEKA